MLRHSSPIRVALLNCMEKANLRIIGWN